MADASDWWPGTHEGMVDGAWREAFQTDRPGGSILSMGGSVLPLGSWGLLLAAQPPGTYELEVAAIEPLHTTFAIGPPETTTVELNPRPRRGGDG